MLAYPLVAGHEVVGRVAAVGADVSHLKTGQVVGLGWHLRLLSSLQQLWQWRS